MVGRRAGIGRVLWLSGIVAGVLAMALVLAGADMVMAALLGFAAGMGLYLALSLGGARNR